MRPCAACTPTFRPTFTEPVKETMSTSGCSVSARPASAPPMTRLTTPGGIPASSQIRVNASDDNGARGDGISTTVQPAASAAATLKLISISG